MKPVITLNHDSLASEMNRMWASVVERFGPPDLIVGVATGGEICARLLENVADVPILACAMRRASTSAKSRGVSKWSLNKLPYVLSNKLRQLEDILLERQDSRQRNIVDHQATQKLLDDAAVVSAHLQNRGGSRILVIDDAVDSGRTLKLVVESIRANLPHNIEIITAVVTHTRANSCYEPDIALYRETLCRFPWSYDFRGTSKV
ncbi:MAG: hypothetical protein HWD84_08160 [Flavobacteriaceae bacterium]|uniref:phosphoribosyltransferase family protein n=1 Tax=Marivivens aquimaris TaxID=2774876 RepID=UPI00185483FA|nr:phosphoribosyltransferase family protein [Marivivens aquimaris]NVJ64185.1 hypothetical protein [Flavobacteriaceae bacterium]